MSELRNQTCGMIILVQMVILILLFLPTLGKDLLDLVYTPTILALISHREVMQSKCPNKYFDMVCYEVKSIGVFGANNESCIILPQEETYSPTRYQTFDEANLQANKLSPDRYGMIIGEKYIFHFLNDTSTCRTPSDHNADIWFMGSFFCFLCIIGIVLVFLLLDLLKEIAFVLQSTIRKYYASPNSLQIPASSGNLYPTGIRYRKQANNPQCPE